MKMTSKKRAIDKIYKRRDRYEIPDWQRQEVWGPSKRQSLIDTILRGWKLPKFYFVKVSAEPEAYEVVDGQQRLVTIWEFFEDELQLAEKTAQDFGGRFHGELPDAVVDSFDDYEIEFDEIQDATEEEVKQFFQRLQEGLRLTSAEKLNSVHSKLRDFVLKLTKHPFFDKISASDRRYGHFDVIAKVAAIEIDGIEVGPRYDDLRAVFESQSEFSSRSHVAKRLKDALDFAAKALEKDTGRVLRNRTMVQSVLTLVCKLISSPRTKDQEKRLGNFIVSFTGELNRQVELGQNATDQDYLEFQRTVNANVRGGARIRQEVMLRKLFGSDPTFADLLDPSAVIESGIRGAIAADATAMVELIVRRNEEFSAKTGTELFKATTKTAQAQAHLGKPVQDFEGYKSFIDNLYFLFHESVGSRLAGNTPQSFVDINVLRTDLRHDVDHGKKGKVKAKRIKMASVFKKYAGVTSPSSMAPERFVVFQANLLGAIKLDLIRLTH
jgi:Protein of unknown function DUF262